MSNVAAGKDTDDEGESLNDVEKTLNSLGITLRKSQYEWKSFEDVLDEVADKWSVFEDTEQSKIATAIAGVRQQENFRALMNNWDEVKDLTDVAANSMGSASEKMEIYLDSVEAKTNEVKATWEEFIIKLNQSDSYKGMLDIVIFLIKNLPTVVTLVGSLAIAWKSFSVASNLKNQATAMREMLSLAINTETIAKNLSAQAQANENVQDTQSITLKSYKSAQLSTLVAAKRAETLATETNTIAEQTETATIETNTVAEQANAVAEQTNAIATEQSTQKRTIKKAVTLQGTAVENTNTTATKMNTTATEASIIADQQKTKTAITLKTVLSGLATVIGVVTAAISIASIGVMAYQSYIQGLKDSVSETAQKVEALQDDIDDLDKSISKYDEIIKSTGSAAEQKEKLLSLQDELKTKYGEEADAIDLVNGKYETQISLLKNMQKEKLEDQLGELQQGETDREKLLSQNVKNMIASTVFDDENSKDDSKTLEALLKGKDTSQYDNLDVYKKVIELANQNNMKLNEFAGDIELTGTRENLFKFKEALEEYSDTLDSEQKKIISRMIQNKPYFYHGSIKTDTEGENQTAYDSKAQQKLLSFQKDNWDEMDSFKENLEKRKELYENYLKETNQDKKASMMAELETETKAILNAKEELYKKAGDNSELIGLLDDYFKQYDIKNLFKTDPTAFSYFDDLVEKVGRTTEAGKNIEAFGKTIDDLDNQFETGKINAKQYFEGINKQIDSIDIDKIDSMYGGIQNLNSMMTSLMSNSANYIGTLMNSFSSGNMDDFEFFDNLDAAVSNFDKITTFLMDADKKGIWQQDGAVDNYDVFKENLYGKDKHMTMETEVVYTDENGNKIDTDTSGNPVIKPTYKDTYFNMKFDSKEIEEQFHNLNSQADQLVEDITKLKSSGVKDDDDSIISKENQLKDINKQIKEITDGTEGVDDAMQDLKDSMKEISDMDFKGLDKAYENLNQAFADGKLKNNVDMTLDQVDSKLKDSAMKMAGFLKEQSESSNEAYSSAAKTALENMGLMADATQEQIATAIINTNTNLNAAANGCNKIASTAMGKSIQNLGNMLIKLGDAMDGFEVSIPIKIPMIKLDLENFKNGGGLFTASDKNLLETEIKIGAAGTIKSIGNMLANADIADSIGNLFTPVEAPVIKKNGTNGNKGYSPSGGGSKKKGSGSDYSAEDAANDLKDILNDIEKYEEDIELDLEDQTEQFINQEMLAANRLDTLKEELDYYNDIYDVTENTSKWLETQNKLLDNQSKKVGSLQNAQASIDAQRKKLIKQNSNYNVESWFDSENNDTLAYGDLINSFEYKKEAIERDTAAKMRAVYNRVSGSKDKDTIKDAKDEIKRIEEEADIKIKALDKEQEKVEKIHDSVGELNDAWKDNQEAIRDALKELHDLVKSMRDELLDDITEQLEKAVDRTNKSLEKSVTRMEQLVTIQEKSNDILNETIDTQQELDSELQASLDSFEYLDEQMRELMFNEDDYKVLSETLTGIQNDVASIWEDHYKQIDELTDDTMYKAEYITAETERQLDMKMREYELAKAELDVAKARTNLQNVKNERNVRMFVGGQWIWTADPNAVKDAQQQLADAEREKNRIEREAEQQRLLDKMNKMIDSDNLQIDENNELLERIQEAIEEQTTEVKSIEDALANASGQDLPALNDVLQGAFGKDGGDFKEIMTNLNKGQTALAAALDGKTTEQAEAQLKRNDMSKSEFEALVKKLGYGWDEKTGTVTTWDGSFKAHYKGWKDTSKPNTPLGTGSNGASVTGGGANGGSSGGGNSGGGGNNQPTSTKSLDAIAKEVIRGKWGNGTERRRRLTAAGYDYNAVQSVVNQLKRQGYFDLGGLATGKGILLKDVKSPERVLSPQQTKSFDRLVDNLTSNPVLQALTKNVKGTSSLKGLVGGSGETKQYYFSNFTVKADNLTEFIDSLEGMIPITNK